ncbi:MULTISPECIES: glycosyltransferase [unclassified Imperialibacter]|uniref:glycosyltransferase n=1 Tax=unclassified Imperialibacter TaxID=2629706 RepID=UPI0012587BBF|nr:MULTISPECIES: glycosyltransferase [unclassified Imperialibacter]CAD5277457.1 Glycosyltransferase involved in cell wall bisynthesis [Imperialibacter sp. 89]CAD5299474.1 Glycosyltransferase involved in cell wall bisynthesis [Imperialibacter sp. 75]VVT27473.1 Glycosyltransferase involved in cell wall bisynthesis [Imperialibacter sp. EC-SDR9]
MRICIARSHKNVLTQTFIRNQIKGLSERAEVFPIYSGRLPQRSDDGKLLSPYPFWLIHQVYKWITGHQSNYFGNYGISRLLKINKIQVVLVNFGTTASHFVPVCKQANIPLVAHFHGRDASKSKVFKQYAYGYQRLFKYAAAIVAVSTEMKKKLIEVGASADKIYIIPYGVDLSIFKPSDKPKTDRPVFLTVGRFVEKKSPQSTIKAFTIVLKSMPECQLIMVGDKSGEFDKCVQLIDELGIQESVVFAGGMPHAEIIDFMNRATVFVQHSVQSGDGDMEGTPNSILEAGACGLPVVSTLHGGIKDAVVEGETGYLVAEHDIEGMARQMLRLAQDSDLAAEMGRKARLRIEQDYNIHTQADKLFHLLQTVADESK